MVWTADAVDAAHRLEARLVEPAATVRAAAAAMTAVARVSSLAGW